MALILPIPDTCEKMREVIVLQPVLEKNLSQFFKIPSGFPKIALGRQVVKLCKNWFLILGKVVFGGEGGIRTPLGW
jgi:hypothetical protein